MVTCHIHKLLTDLLDVDNTQVKEGADQNDTQVRGSADQTMHHDHCGSCWPAIFMSCSSHDEVVKYMSTGWCSVCRDIASNEEGDD